jgi:hypothetical protein
MLPLKTRLQTLRERDFSISSDLNHLSLLNEMLENIGSPDSELRDDLIYTCLCEWITSKPLYSVDELQETWPLLLDSRHLFFHIGEEGTDTVFTRSFSILALALIIYRHREEAFLSKENLQRILDALCRFVSEERDLRGFVPGPGWAHAMAHSADALDELAQCAELDESDLLQILDAILAGMSRPQAPFVQREDERMVTAFVSLVKRNLIPFEEISAHLAETVEVLREKPFDPRNFSAWNFRNFLRALYFRLTRTGQVDNAAEIRKLEDALIAPRS